MKTKVCCACHDDKELDQFDFRYKNKGIRQRICKECKKKARKRSYEKHKSHVINKNIANKAKNVAWFNEYKKTLKCARCPEDHPACLEFHHLDPSVKEKSVSKMASSTYSRAKIMKEINKCIVLCSNCHRKLHFDEQHPLL